MAAVEYLPDTLDLAALREAVDGCRGCDLYKSASQAVFGEGVAGAEVMFVGEQPGDQEDQTGKPFVGPAGRLLDRAMEEAGIDRSRAYVTNVVKHFKWKRTFTSPGVPGKRRLHDKPNAYEVRACRPWLEAEIRQVKPRIVVLMGMTAAQALLGPTFRVTRQRGQFIKTAEGVWLTATVHPSSILRAPDAQAREEEMEQFVTDLRLVADRLAEGGETG